MRAAIGRRMVDSKRQAPHFYVSTEIEIDAAIVAVERLNARLAPDDRISLTAIIINALARTLQRNPRFNAVWNGDVLETVDAINIGVAVAVDDGLLAPAILDCQDLDLPALSRALRDLVARARAGRLRADELEHPTFTLSNLGMFPVTSFSAIVVPPQVAILATGRTEPRAVVCDGQIVIRQVLTATLSADHRAVDGAGAARFLGDLRDHLLEPDAWLSAAVSR